jgi:hypothetical protein
LQRVGQLGEDKRGDCHAYEGSRRPGGLEPGGLIQTHSCLRVSLRGEWGAAGAGDQGRGEMIITEVSGGGVGKVMNIGQEPADGRRLRRRGPEAGHILGLHRGAGRRV